MLAGRQIVIILVTCSHSREYTGAIKWEIFNKSAESYTVTCRSWHDSGRGQFLSPLKSDMMPSKFEGTPPTWKIWFKSDPCSWRSKTHRGILGRLLSVEISRSSPLPLWFWKGYDFEIVRGVSGLWLYIFFSGMFKGALNFLRSKKLKGKLGYLL